MSVFLSNCQILPLKSLNRMSSKGIFNSQTAENLFFCAFLPICIIDYNLWLVFTITKHLLFCFVGSMLTSYLHFCIQDLQYLYTWYCIMPFWHLSDHDLMPHQSRDAALIPISPSKLRLSDRKISLHLGDKILLKLFFFPTKQMTRTINIIADGHVDLSQGQPCRKQECLKRC